MGQTLIELLEIQKNTALSLSSLLEREKFAIANRKSVEIEQLAQQKLGLLNQLQQTDHLLGTHPERQLLIDDDSLHSRVSEIKSIVHDCQQENVSNGEALQRAQLSYNKLNNLLQQSRGKSGMTYTSEGQAQNITTLGTNVKA